jgi:hypothetical protein
MNHHTLKAVIGSDRKGRIAVTLSSGKTIKGDRARIDAPQGPVESLVLFKRRIFGPSQAIHIDPDIIDAVSVDV